MGYLTAAYVAPFITGGQPAWAGAGAGLYRAVRPRCPSLIDVRRQLTRPTDCRRIYLSGKSGIDDNAR